MELFILRHGQAELHAANDAARQLVERGRQDVARIIHACMDDLQQVEEIWVSPLVRAQQTARIAAENFKNTMLVSRNFLTPDSDPQQVIQQLQMTTFHSLLLVSHQPLVSRLVEMCCGFLPSGYPMDTAAMACIDFNYVGANSGHLRWLRHPAS